MKITETVKELIEEKVKELGDVPLQNKQALRKILTNLFERAWKGNRAYYKLEDKWGFVGDYAGPQDWGNELPVINSKQ